MNRAIVATVAGKDLRQVAGRRSVRTSLVVFPLVVAVGLPLVVRFAGHRSGGIPAGAIPPLLNAFTVIFVIGAAVLPTAIASYSLVGEKVERSLEPLLATPATDGEILLGKSIAAVLPPLIVLWAGSAVFMALSDALTRTKLGYNYFPTGHTLLIVLLLVPLAAVLSVQYSVLVSARVSDVRAAQQLAGLAVLPFAALYLAAELRLYTVDNTSVAIICAALVAVDIGLFALTRATFRREEILTRWK